MIYGFTRIAVAVPKVRVADVRGNVAEIARAWEEAEGRGASVVLFPELSVTGYSCGDLFFQRRLHEAVAEGLEELLARSAKLKSAAVVGAPLWYEGRLYNCALVLQKGEIAGAVPKSFVPEHKEYYEKRWFLSGAGVTDARATLPGREVPFGVDLLFEMAEGPLIGVEVCEDLWSVVPPSSWQALAGATLLLNLSASDEIVGKSDYRLQLVSQQSARCMAAYAYASCGVGESTTDVVFGGDAMVCENGALLARGERFVDETRIVYADVDIERLETIRLSEGSFADGEVRPFRRIPLESVPAPKRLERFVDPHPFVPSDPKERDVRCREIFAIQSSGLARRVGHIGSRTCIVGISGGLDSTLALLVTRRAFDRLGKKPEEILCVTMPGFGTTSRTLANAEALCRGLGVTLKKIDITEACLAHFEAIGHDPEIHDVVFENVQARERTQILMDLANEHGGIVVGTGDLSEIALGWSTYNGDHMSMYAVNAGVPKTLVRYLVAWAADALYPELAPVLRDILETPVSPELLPAEEGEICQKTEEVVGPYELHDFFLYHMIKSGASPRKLLFLARHAFGERYGEEELRKWLELFLRRFFTQQFKRSCMPDGPKVGTIALSPRGDWRMPSDAEVKEWIASLQEDE
ncbi:NAD(+) synthase [Hydrogenimonas sp.]